MSQQWFPDDAGASLSPAAQPCGAVEPAPVAVVPPAHPPAEQPAPPSDKPIQPAAELGHQPHAPVELTDQELEFLDQPIELPINPTPFGASPARLAGRGPTPARRLVSPQEAAASNRLCERAGDFGPEFIELARSVYRTNDRRSDLKRQVNAMLGSRPGG